MANLTKKEKSIVELYVRYFGKAPSVDEIKKYNDVGNLKQITTEIIGDSDVIKPLNDKDFVNSAFQNLFGRDATLKEMNKYIKFVEKGKNLPLGAIKNAAKKSDKAVYEAKKAIAIMLAEQGNTTNYNLDKITKDTYADVYNLKTKKLLVDTVAQLETKIEAMPENVTGQTYMLTAGVDMGEAFVGTEKSDIYYSLDALIPSTLAQKETWTTGDTLDGKEGNDILNIQTGIAIPTGTLLNLTSIETVNVNSTTTVDLDGSAWDGTNTLNVTKATAATLTAAATTDVNVSGVTGAIVVKGGNDVVVTDSKAGAAITVSNGATGNATGTITVTDTDNSAANTITVNGGTDVTVTATATASTTGAIAIGGAKAATGDVKVTQNLNSANDAADITAAAINVTGGKTVTVTTNATTTAKSETSDNDITVSAVTVTADEKTTDVTVINNVVETTFTKPAVELVGASQTVTFKDLASGANLVVNGLTFTASKDLTAAEVAAAFANLTSGDTQSATGITANGYYTGTFSTTNWTSAAANGATVTFTGASATETAMVISDATLVTTKTNGTPAATAITSTNGVTLNTVVIDDNATKSIENITVKGATTVTLGGTSDLDKIKTISLENVTGAVTLDTAATALNLTLNKVVNTVNLDAAAANITDLTIKTTGEKSTISTLTAAAVKNATIDAGAELVINAIGTTNKLETVTVKGTAAVTLGTVATSNILKSFDASANTGGVTASINAATAGSHTDLKTFVFSAGNDKVTVANIVNKAINLGAGDDKITLDDGTDTLAEITGTIDGGAGTDTIHMTAALAVVATGASSTFDTQISNIEKLSLGTLGAASTVDLAKIDNISYVISANNAAFLLTLNNMANNGTLELASGLAATNDTTVTMKDASGNNDTFNIVTNVNTADLIMGTVTVAGVETININAIDLSSDIAKGNTIEEATLELTADAAKTVNVTGSSDVDLTLTGSTKVTMIDATNLTGALTATTAISTSAATIKGGSGADDLTATTTNDKLYGNAGGDTLTVANGANLVQLYGGEGKDTYVIGVATNSNGYATINGTKAELSGDVIQFNAAISTMSSLAKIDNLGSTAVFQDYVNEAAKGTTADNKVAWFQLDGNTYVVQNNSTLDSFANGVDAVVKITGLVDLTFNDTTNVLEIA